MECQNTIKNLRINKHKTIGTIVIVVEGEEDEFRLLKHIFTKILDYNYISMKRKKIMQHEFQSKTNKNCNVIVANTKSSSIKTITDENEYKDKLYNLLKTEFNKNLKNTRIYIIWDRDKDTKKDKTIQSYYKKAINTFTNSMDNNYEMNGILLLSYPCHESYNLSNFDKRLYQYNYNTSDECKKAFNSSKHYIKDINEQTLLVAVQNMHNSMLKYNIRNYDLDNFKRTNEIIYRKQEENFKNNKYFNALSLISIMLIDLGIIEDYDN